jgi:hypothetical protein
MTNSPLRPGKKLGTVTKLEDSSLGITPIRTNPALQANTPEHANTYAQEPILTDVYDLVTSLQRSSKTNYTHLLTVMRAGYSNQGFVWHFRIPDDLLFCTSNNLLEFLVAIIMPCIDIIGGLSPGDCTLSMTDSTTAKGWMKIKLQRGRQ